MDKKHSPRLQNIKPPAYTPEFFPRGTLSLSKCLVVCYTYNQGDIPLKNRKTAFSLQRKRFTYIYYGSPITPSPISPIAQGNLLSRTNMAGFLAYGFAEEERLLRTAVPMALVPLFVNHSNGCCDGFAPLLPNSPILL